MELYYQGLYVEVMPDGKLKRRLCTLTEETPLCDTTIAEELIQLTERHYPPLYKFTGSSVSLSRNLPHNPDLFQKYLDDVDRYLHHCEAIDPVFVFLSRTLLWRDFDNPQKKKEAVSRIATHLYTPVQLQAQTIRVLNRLCSKGPIEESLRNRVLRYSGCTTIFKMNKQLEAQHVFRAFEQYYKFLLQNLILAEPNIVRCQYCGGYFVPKTKRKTLYCDRVIRDGRTCKQIAPQLTRKQKAAANQVISEYNRVKDMLCHRLDRQDGIKKPSPIDIERADYYEWEEAATAARKQFLAGEVTEEKALATIHVPTKKEMMEKESSDYTLDFSLASS